MEKRSKKAFIVLIISTFILLITQIEVINIKEQYSKGNFNNTSLLGNRTISTNNVNSSKVNTKNIDNYIKKYIKDNYRNKKDVIYNFNLIDNKIVSVLFTDETTNTHQSFLIDINTDLLLDIDSIVNNVSEFNDIVNRELSKKYPKFIVDGINSSLAKITSYEIKNNEMIIYYDNVITNPVVNKSLFININYNIIKKYLKIKCVLDKEFTPNTYDISGLDKVIALTFDDGPKEGSTSSIINTLKENNVNATFFMQGYRMLPNKLLVQELVSNGNEVGNHTYNHKYLTKLDKEGIDFQINVTNERFNEITGKNISLVRPPYGSYSKTVESLINYPLILWDVDTEDWKIYEVPIIISNVLNNVSDGNIVLMHDVYDRTAEALKTILPELYVRGYRVVTISKLAEIKKVTLQPGIAYRNIK